MEGFAADTDKGSVMVGFGRNAVLGVADTVIEAVKSKAIRHFFLVGGCDGAKPGRDYYTQFVEQVPADCMVLTLACGKFRFFDKDLGSIGGIPRLLDVGQCNDAYSAIKIAVALADAFKCGVNDLPLSMILSWYEQKAVAILLTLLHLGIKDIRLGPSLPAFVTPAVLQVLVDNFAIKPVADAGGGPGGHPRHEVVVRGATQWGPRRLVPASGRRPDRPSCGPGRARACCARGRTPGTRPGSPARRRPGTPRCTLRCTPR